MVWGLLFGTALQCQLPVLRGLTSKQPVPLDVSIFAGALRILGQGRSCLWPSWPLRSAVRAGIHELEDNASGILEFGTPLDHASLGLYKGWPRHSSALTSTSSASPRSSRSYEETVGHTLGTVYLRNCVFGSSVFPAGGGVA